MLKIPLSFHILLFPVSDFATDLFFTNTNTAWSPPSLARAACPQGARQLSVEYAITVPRPSVTAPGQFNSSTGMPSKSLCSRSALRHLRKEPFQMKCQQEKCNLPRLLSAPENKHVQTLPATERLYPKAEGENTSQSSTSLSGCLNRNSRCSQISNRKGYNHLSTESNTKGKHEIFCLFFKVENLRSTLRLCSSGTGNPGASL